VQACGICGSDIHGMDGRSGRRQPCPSSWVMRLQVKSSRLGEGATDWKVGDRVTFDSTEYCGECDDCQSGYVNLCSKPKACWASPLASIAVTAALPKRSCYQTRILYLIPQKHSVL
jgi:L-iditol 2-dehydrogenase